VALLAKTVIFEKIWGTAIVVNFVRLKILATQHMSTHGHWCNQALLGALPQYDLFVCVCVCVCELKDSCDAHAWTPLLSSCSRDSLPQCDTCDLQLAKPSYTSSIRQFFSGLSLNMTCSSVCVRACVCFTLLGSHPQYDLLE
jgi:hypothetical protein